MSPDDLARRINAAEGPAAVVYLAGGGTEVLPILLARGGGSATLLSARVPYDPADFLAILGADPRPARLAEGRPGAGDGRVPPRPDDPGGPAALRLSSASGRPRSSPGGRPSARGGRTRSTRRSSPNRRPSPARSSCPRAATAPGRSGSTPLALLNPARPRQGPDRLGPRSSTTARPSRRGTSPTGGSRRGAIHPGLPGLPRRPAPLAGPGVRRRRGTLSDRGRRPAPPPVARELPPGACRPSPDGGGRLGDRGPAVRLRDLADPPGEAAAGPIWRSRPAWRASPGSRAGST